MGVTITGGVEVSTGVFFERAPLDPYIVSLNPSQWLKFNEVPGLTSPTRWASGTTWNNYGSATNDATLYNGTQAPTDPVAYSSTYALARPGTAGVTATFYAYYVAEATTSYINQDLTLSFCVRTSTAFATTAADHYIWQQGGFAVSNNQGLTFMYSVTNASTHSFYVIYFNSVWRSQAIQIPTQYMLENSSKYNLTVTWDYNGGINGYGRARLYINGTYVTYLDLTHPVPSTSQNAAWGVGKNSDTSSNGSYFNGDFNYCVIIPNILTDAEISKLAALSIPGVQYVP